MEDKNESIEKINESLLKVFKEIDDLFLLLSKEAIKGRLSSSFMDRYLSLREIFPKVNNTLKEFKGDKNV